jgi:hypothetical protein
MITNVMHEFVYFYFFPYLLLPYMFRSFFKPIFQRHCVQIRQCSYYISNLARTLTIQFQPGPDAEPMPRILGSLPNLYTLPLKDGLKERRKHIRQKYIKKKIKSLFITLVVIQFHFKMRGP